MIVYLYDSDCGVFLNEYNAQENPKRKGEFLCPRFSTCIKPVIKEGFIPVFDGLKWMQVPDNRGEEIINPETRETNICQDIGDLPDGFMLYSEYIQTEEYANACITAEREEKRRNLLMQIDELDKKRVRAICEPEQKTNDISWLQYYTNQIVELRKQLQEV